MEVIAASFLFVIGHLAHDEKLVSCFDVLVPLSLVQDFHEDLHLDQLVEGPVLVCLREQCSLE